MAGPARAGVFVYALDVERIAAFYAHVLGLARVHARADLVVLDGPDLQLLVLAMPPMAGALTPAPDAPRAGALGFFATVDALADAAACAAQRGGRVLDGRWAGPGFTVARAMDPEGNAFQLREPRA